MRSVRVSTLRVRASEFFRRKLLSIDMTRFRSLVFGDTDSKFARWAMDAILEWENTETKGTVIHIHGTEDMIIPLRNIEHTDFIIPDAGHSMVFQEPEKISSILHKVM